MLNKAVIDLRVLKENATAVKGLLPNSTKFCAVVKADAYGHGGVECANALYNIADCFAVALVEEGINLRLSGIDKEILVLTPVYPDDCELIIRYDLTATVCSFFQAKMLERVAKSMERAVKVHIKFNSGMNRQGVDSLLELEQIASQFYKSEYVKICGLYSHFANPENKSARRIAQNKFLLANNCVKSYNKNIVCHISASGGMLSGVFYDMVRVGILLYGYKPFPTDKITVRPIMKILSPILRERTIKEGESALYGDFPSKKEQKLSLVRYGYADGLDRVAVDGQFNNRCMDVTAYTDPIIEEGYAVVMEDAEELARKYNTISYEILTKSAMRAEKIYLR